MNMTITTPTIMKVLVSFPFIRGEGGVVVKPDSGMVRGEGVAEGAVVVVETKNNPGEEEGGDGGSPGARVDDTIVAVIAHTQKLKQITVLEYTTYLY